MSSASTHPFIRNRVTWLCYCMLGLFTYAVTVLGPVMPFLRTELDLTYTQGGLHSSMFAFGGLVVSLLSTSLVRWWGRRVAFWVGSLGLGLGTALLAFSSTIILTLTSVFVMGFMGVLSLIMMNAMLSDQYGEQQSIALTEANVAATLCGSLAPALVGLAQTTPMGWRGALLLVPLAVLLLGVLFMRASLPGTRQPAPQVALAAPTHLPPLFWVYWLALLLGVAVEWCFVIWSADFLERVVGLPRSEAVALISVFLIAMLIGRAIGSWLTRTRSPATLLAGSVVIALAGFLLFWLARFAPLNVLGLALAGLGVANMFPLSLALALSTARHQADLASARASIAGTLSLLSAPLLLGWLADHVGMALGFGIVALVLVLMLLVLVLARKLTRAILEV